MKISEIRAVIFDLRQRARNYPDADARVLRMLNALLSYSSTLERRIAVLEAANPRIELRQRAARQPGRRITRKKGSR